MNCLQFPFLVQYTSFCACVKRQQAQARPFEVGLLKQVIHIFIAHRAVLEHCWTRLWLFRQLRPHNDFSLKGAVVVNAGDGFLLFANTHAKGFSKNVVATVVKAPCKGFPSNAYCSVDVVKRAVVSTSN